MGDDDQSIYGWRGAEVPHILRFKNDWPEAKVVRLEKNYRSTAAILDMANRLIAFNKRAARQGAAGRPRRRRAAADPAVQGRNRRSPARPWPTSAAGSRPTSLQPRDFAILFRTNEQPRAFETELRQAKIPYVLLGGMSFFDRKEVRDILAYLQLLDSPRDEVSLLRIINTPPRGIGDKTVETLLKEAVGRGAAAVGGAERSQRCRRPPARATAREADRASSSRSIERVLTPSSPRQRRSRSSISLRRLIAEIGYESGTAAASTPTRTSSRPAGQSVEEVVNALGAYAKRPKKPTLGGFLDEVTLGQQDMGDDKEKQLAKNAVALMTLHAAKGLEFPHVYMVGMEEGILPHHRSLRPTATTSTKSAGCATSASPAPRTG